MSHTRGLRIHFKGLRTSANRLPEAESALQSDFGADPDKRSELRWSQLKRCPYGGRTASHLKSIGPTSATHGKFRPRQREMVATHKSAIGNVALFHER